MIEIYTGTPGSGKSLHCAEMIRKWLSIFGDPVIVNFDINVSKIKVKKNGGLFYIDNKELNPFFLVEFAKQYRERNKIKRLKEDRILLVIDECQILFNSRSWNSPDRMSWITFFSQHRKLGYKVILVAQYIDMIDKQIRPLIEYEVLHRKVKNIGLGGKLINLMALGGLHVSNKKYLPTNLVVNTEFFKGNIIVYDMYDTFNIFKKQETVSDA